MLFAHPKILLHLEQHLEIDMVWQKGKKQIDKKSPDDKVKPDDNKTTDESTKKPTDQLSGKGGVAGRGQSTKLELDPNRFGPLATQYEEGHRWFQRWW